MQATRPFHSANQIPDGSTVCATASDISGNVQADAHCLCGGDDHHDATWTLADMEAGTACAVLHGPAFSMVRVRLALAANSSARFDIVISHNGQEIRRRTWRFAAASNTTTRFGLVISVEAPN